MKHSGDEVPAESHSLPGSTTLAGDEWQQPGQVPSGSGTPEKWKLGASLSIAAFVWFCDWTDYSLPGTFADLLLPVLGIMAGVVALRASKHIPARGARVAAKVGALVTLFEASVAVAGALLIAAIAPFAAALLIFNAMGETQIVSVVSPDGSRVAEEYYTGGGLLSDGWVVVRVKYRLLPLLERDVYQGAGDASEAVRWDDNDTLYVPATGERVKLGLVKAELAPAVQLVVTGWGLVGVLSHTHKEVEKMQRRDEEMSRPLKTIPLYPGGTENDYSGANLSGEGGFRAFDIKAPNSDEAAKWYKEVLSRAEWRVLSTKRRETRGETVASRGEERLVYNCIEALRQEGDATSRGTGTGTTKHYYWRFLWGEQSTHVRVIVDTPEPPPWSDCDEPHGP